MSFKENDRVKVIMENSVYTDKKGTVTLVYCDGTAFAVKFDHDWHESGFFESELELLDIVDEKREALIELAETLNTARLQANAIEEMAPQSGVYGDIAQAMVVVLCTLTGRFEVGDIYDSLLDGNTVREALAAVAR